MSETPDSLRNHLEHDPKNPVSVHSMTIAYDERPVLWDVDLDIPAGKLVAVVGPNGAGKTTFLRGCLGLIKPLSGRVEFWGRSYSEVRSRVAYVPQREGVDWAFPITVLELVCMGQYGKLGWFRRVRAGEIAIARNALQAVGMERYANRQISQLSGGQQQRVFLARALTQEAELYFMDEPFAGVDSATERAIVTILQGLKANGATVVAVHHDLNTVPEYFDSVILINTRIIAHGSVRSEFSPENLKRTYGGRLTALEAVSEAIARSKGGA